jgi:hypothetical protein
MARSRILVVARAEDGEVVGSVAPLDNAIRSQAL